MNPKQASVLLACVMVAACGKPAPAAEEMDMGMPADVTFSAEQIAHGSVKWAATRRVLSRPCSMPCGKIPTC